MGTQYQAKTVAAGHSTVTINDNLTDIEDALDRSLSRYPDSPNEMQSDLDMNSFCIINLDPDCAEGLGRTYVDCNGAEVPNGAAIATCDDLNDAIQEVETCPPLETTQLVANHELVSGDREAFLFSEEATDITITLPAGLPVGYHVTVFRAGTGNVIFAAGAGATLNSTGTQITDQYTAVTVISYKADTWTVLGGLS